MARRVRTTPFVIVGPSYPTLMSKFVRYRTKCFHTVLQCTLDQVKECLSFLSYLGVRYAIEGSIFRRSGVFQGTVSSLRSLSS